MVTISKGNEKLIVTKGAYEQLFKSLGYTIVSNKKPVEQTIKIVETGTKQVTTEPVFNKRVNTKSERPTEKTKKVVE